MSSQRWRGYEEVATYLLNQFSKEFGLKMVEGKQLVPGASGTNWEIDAKGYSDNGDGFLIVECKCYSDSSVNQGTLAHLAYEIKDTGAEGGIIVTTVDFQEGAKKIAAHEGIATVVLDINSTTKDYILKYLTKTFAGVSIHGKAKATANFGVVVIEPSTKA